VRLLFVDQLEDVARPRVAGRVVACRIASRGVGLVGIGAGAEEHAGDGEIALLHRDDQRRFAHPVRGIHLGAEPEQPFDGGLKAHPGGGDQGRLARLARQVRIRSLVE